jgi:hypothetical protein
LWRATGRQGDAAALGISEPIQFAWQLVGRLDCSYLLASALAS